MSVIDEWVYKIYWTSHMSICGSFVGLSQDFSLEKLGRIVDNLEDKEKVYILATESETGPATQMLIDYLRENYGLFQHQKIDL